MFLLIGLSPLYATRRGGITKLTIDSSVSWLQIACINKEKLGDARKRICL
jgi:hypothetical protein